MNSVEMLLRALGACQAIVAKSFARAHGIDLHDFLVVLEDDLDHDGFLKGKPGLQEIRFAFYIAIDAPQGKVDQFVEFIKSRCPVSDTLLNGVKSLQSDVGVERSKVYT
jgi:uncharacterized OsmC-like protein